MFVDIPRYCGLALDAGTNLIGEVAGIVRIVAEDRTKEAGLVRAGSMLGV